MTASDDRRLLLVHAHPDDETINTGATMAHYAAQGARVTLVTCTLGEEGEILLPELAQLAADQADQLGGWRIAELDRAMSQLGVSDHRFLGGAGRFRDSGMRGSPANDRPRAFWRAASDPAVFTEAVDALVRVIRQVRPQVVVSYDDFGGYGHPDHIMAHRVTTAAVVQAARPDYTTDGEPWESEPWRVAKFYWTALPHSALERGLVAMRTVPDLPFELVATTAELHAVPDELVTTAVATRHGAAKLRALAEHGTQVSVHGEYFALSNNLGQPALATEYFRLVGGLPGGPVDADGRETDLFGGLSVGDRS